MERKRWGGGLPVRIQSPCTLKFLLVQRSFFFAVGLLGLFVFAACSGGPVTLQSQPGVRAPTIDGSLVEWKGALSSIGDRPISMNVFPADSLLYVVLSIRDPELLRALAQKGLTVWVDPKGNRRRVYGIRYPIGLRAQRIREQSKEQASQGSQGESPVSQVFPSDLAILRNDTVRHRVPAQFSTGPRVSARLNPGSLTYEIAIPISRSSSGAPERAQKLGITSPLSDRLSVGLEIPESEDTNRLRQSPPASVTGNRGGPPSRRRQPRRRQRSTIDRGSDLASLFLWRQVVWGQNG